ncbi:hypothetical protein E2C01_096797 [Portunus trituberculatus]|uniref:Uncharacterized protein n=1 Tax=Portunus trituberculatus TaxID=210409 RepID=A0A5B7K7S9_PORTR|nr:hypothetical protein [Portunus trituberculatus]
MRPTPTRKKTLASSSCTQPRRSTA